MHAAWSFRSRPPRPFKHVYAHASPPALTPGAPAQVDTNLLRPQQYREYWAEERDRRWARELHELLRPGEEPRASGGGGGGARAQQS